MDPPVLIFLYDRISPNKNFTIIGIKLIAMQEFQYGKKKKKKTYVVVQFLFSFVFACNIFMVMCMYYKSITNKGK